MVNVLLGASILQVEAAVLKRCDCLNSLLHRRQAHLCILANNCDEAMYKKLVEALCAEHSINLYKVS